MEDCKVDTFSAFKYNVYIWRLLGYLPTEKYKFLYYIYSTFINITVIAYYPLSLIINVFVVKATKELLEGMCATIADLICSLKAFNILFQRHKLLKVKEYTKILDARAKDTDESDLLKRAIKKCRKFFFIYLTVYYIVAVTDELVVVFAPYRRIMYPAWFPIDWRASELNYWIIHFYQIIGISIQITLNVADNTYPALYLCILCSHFKAMCMRIEKLGRDSEKSEEEHYQDLVACAKDHLILLDYCKSVQSMMSCIMLLQLFSSEATLCITAFYALSIQLSLFEIVYIGSFFTSMFMEIALTCYYGNELMVVSNEITTALYSCNWMDRSLKFKKAMLIFMSKTQKINAIYAGNFIAVSMSTFLTVLKTAYSLYAVLHHMDSLTEQI